MKQYIVLQSHDSKLIDQYINEAASRGYALFSFNSFMCGSSLTYVACMRKQHQEGGDAHDV